MDLSSVFKSGLTKPWAKPLSARAITLTVAILSTIATALSSITDPTSSFHTTPAQALLISSIGAGLYAFVRAIQKLKTGEPLKAILATSEAKGVAIVYLASVATALKGVVPPAYAGVAALLTTALMAASRMFVSSDKGGPPTAGPPAAFAGLVLLAAGLVAAPAWSAPKVQLGGCNDAGTICCQPAVAITAIQCTLSDFECVRAALNAGYGCVYKGLPVNFGVAGYAGIGIAKKGPNAPQLNLLFSVADLGAVGPGLQVYKDPFTGKPVWELLGTLAVNLNIGGTTTYVEKLVEAYEHSDERPDASPPPASPAPDAAPDGGAPKSVSSPDAGVVDAGTPDSLSPDSVEVR